MAEVKGELGLLLWLLMVAVLAYAGVSLTSGFIEGIVVAAAWLFVRSALQNSGVKDKAVSNLFLSAAGFALFAASFELLLVAVQPVVAGMFWINYLVSLGYALSWIAAMVASLALAVKNFS